MRERTIVLRTRVKPDEWERIKDNAGKSVSGYIRKTALEHMAGGPTIASELHELRRQVSAIGNNVNQMAKRVNQGEQAEIGTLQDMLNGIQRDINERLKRVE